MIPQNYKTLICAAFLHICFSSAAQVNPKRMLLGISKTDHILAIIDPVTLKVINRIPVGDDPHEVEVSSDGRTTYVSNTGFGALHEINAIDLVNQKVLENINTQPLYGPHGMAFVNGKLWFTAQGSKAVGQYNPAANAVEWSIGTGQNTTHLIYVTEDAKHFYTTNSDSGTISIFENLLLEPTIPPTGKLPANAKPRMDWVQTILEVGKGAEGFDVSPDGRELWTARPDGMIVIVDPIAKKIVRNIDSKVLGLHRLKFTPDGKKVFICSVRTGDLLIYDAVSHKEIKILNVGQGAGIMMDKAGNRAFISCTPNNYIAIVDLDTLTVSDKLEIGGRPDGMAIALQQ